MRTSTLTFLFLACCPVLAAQEALTTPQALDRLQAVLDRETRTLADVEARRVAAAEWLAATSQLDLGELSWVRLLAEYRALDETKAGGRAAFDALAKKVLAQVKGAKGSGSSASPGARRFDATIGNILMGHTVRLADAGNFAALDDVLPVTLDHLRDHMSIFWLIGRRARDKHGEPGARYLRQQVIPRILSDHGLSDRERVELLRKLLEVSYDGPRPMREVKGRDLDGKPVSSADYRGQVLLIDFWATWCVPCKLAMPHVVAAYEKYQPRGFRVLGVSLDRENAETRIRADAKKLRMSWPQLYDGGFWKTRWAVENGVRAIPATFLIDRSGRVRYTNLEPEELDRRIAELLAESR